MVESATGVGPVDSALRAVQKLVGDTIRLTDFKIEAITGGSDALAEVFIGVEDSDGNTFTARAARDDIVMASVEALVNAINRMIVLKKMRK
jgi:2-isopropylmalate synthase